MWAASRPPASRLGRARHGSENGARHPKTQPDDNEVLEAHVRRGVKVMAVAALLSITAACGSGSSNDAADSSGSGGLTDVTVGIVPFTPNAVLFLAQKNGIFKKHGLNVTTESAAAPTPIVASMVAGKEQFGFLTTPVLINASSQGTSVKCVSPVDGQTAADRD